jgi:hypothetical protein
LTFLEDQITNTMPKVKESTRSAATGHKEGKAAKRARTKNAAAVEEFLSLIERARTADDAERLMTENGLMLAHVIKATGAGRLEVRLLDGLEGSFPIAGSIKFRGGAATKGDRENCMTSGDLVVIRGSFAAGKFRRATAIRVRGLFKHHGLSYPSIFFPAEDGSRDDLFNHDSDDDDEVDVDVV